MKLLFNPPVDVPIPTKTNHPSHEEVFLRQQVAQRLRPIFEAHNLIQFSTPPFVPASGFSAEESQRLVDAQGQVWIRCQEPAADFAHFLTESGAKRLKRYDLLQVPAVLTCRSQERMKSMSATWTWPVQMASQGLTTLS